MKYILIIKVYTTNITFDLIYLPQDNKRNTFHFICEAYKLLIKLEAYKTTNLIFLIYLFGLLLYFLWLK